MGVALIRAERRTDMKKLTGACRNYSNTLYLDYLQKHCVIKEARQVCLHIMSRKANSQFTPAIRKVQNAIARVILVA